jgi:peptidoglycan/LPS O-acetylase OafA/YrhL
MLATQLSECTSDNSKFDYRKFMVKRIARIYPAHLVTLFFMGLLALITTSANLQPFITYNDDLLNFVASIIFLNGVGLMRGTSFNLPSWSLSVEFICYLLFATTCLVTTKRRSILFFLGFLIGALITEISSDPNTDNLGSGIIFFFCGALGSAIMKPRIAGTTRRSIRYTSAVLAVGFISFYLSLSTNLGAQKLIWLFVTLPTCIISLEQIDRYLNQGRYRPFRWFGLVSF